MGLNTTQVYSPGSDEQQEFEDFDILEARTFCSDQYEFHVLWKIYSIFESTWDTESYVINAPEILSDSCYHCNLLLAKALLEGESYYNYIYIFLVFCLIFYSSIFLVFIHYFEIICCIT